MKVKLSNVGIVENCDVEFVPGMNLIVGSSGSGKSTLMRTIHNFVSNEFSDADISFGKNKMEICIEHNGSVLKYVRHIKTTGDKCAYTVNGENYVKLGRQPLKQITDNLKIGSVTINGDDINFNFNLQFASPFLILGNQSTLYNVLTYRSAFDISSINDFYSIDIKNNAAEISVVEKMKEKLEDNLDSLKEQSEKLSSIEELYSRYTDCKHKGIIIDDVSALLNKLLNLRSLQQRVCIIAKCVKDIESLLNVFSVANDVSKLKNLHSEIACLSNKQRVIKETCERQEVAMHDISMLADFSKLNSSLNLFTSLNQNIVKLNSVVDTCSSIVQNDVFIYDIIKQYNNVKLKYKNTAIADCLSKLDKIDLNAITNSNHIKELLSNRQANLNSYENVNKQLDVVKSEISNFKVCPLCGNSVHL